MKIFLSRHASPDWNRTDIPYDIPPGPPLSPKGEAEALRLAEFLRTQNVKKLYTSPFERSAKTAAIIAAQNGIPFQEDDRLQEWREGTEDPQVVRHRMLDIFKQAAEESIREGAIGLVSHGGPTAFLLQELGISPEYLAEFRKKFDRENPLPPAGAWKVEWNELSQNWMFNLEFVPSEH